jgi:NTE family protein
MRAVGRLGDPIQDPASPVRPIPTDDGSGPYPGIALCLSGGGYRAMLFHLGAIWRLNEVAYLSKLSRISSVSGGSITAGLLGYRWSRLEFVNGIATRLSHAEIRLELP